MKYVEKKATLLAGFREKGSSLLADLSRCEILVPAVGQRLQALRSVIDDLEGRASIPQLEIAADCPSPGEPL